MTLQDGATVQERFARLGIDVNGLIIPGRSIESVLARHALNLFVSNDDETYKVSLPGSATALRYRGRELLLVTQHQLDGVDHSRVAMMTESGSHIITSGGRRGYLPSSETDANDIVAFDFTEPCKDWPELAPRFFNLTRMLPPVLGPEVIVVLLMGFPAAVQKYEVHENNHLGLTRLHVHGFPHSQPSDQALLHVRASRPLEVHPDGMSGGPAFLIRQSGDGLMADFAGMIVRGGREDFYILKAGVIHAFLDSLFPR